jgi:pimeloyl-ACP methyl ester carboxylesterase
MPTSPPTASGADTGVPTDVRGGVRLAIDGVQGVIGIVESMHERIASRAPAIGAAPERRTRGLTGFVYRRVRGTTRLVGAGLDLALGAMERMPIPPLPPGAGSRRDAAVAALNGVLGDHLVRSANPLAIRMQLRVDHTLGIRPHLLVLVHGLCMTGSQWKRKGHDHGLALARAMGATPIYVSYNSGRPIGTNGAELAGLLAGLVADWAVPVESVTLIGHSMGGLVARSAVACAQADGPAWVERLRAMVFLGTPHQGAPLERAGHWVHSVLGISPYVAPLARVAGLRSAGILDLRHGNLQGAGPEGRIAHGPLPAVVPLPDGVACYAIAGSLAPAPLGDGLVTVESALGRSGRAQRDLAFPADHLRVVEGCGHLDLLCHPEVLDQMRTWLAPKAGRRAAK